MTGDYKSGFISLAGRPNVGKSTLLNALVGQKVTIISDKPQTTRNKILSVLTREDAQVIFLDTPGIHKPRHKLGLHMVEIALNTLRVVDVILLIVEANKAFGYGDDYIIQKLEGIDTPAMLVINKIDLVSRLELLPLIDIYRQKKNFTEIIPISALKGENLNLLLDLIIKYLPAGPQYYPQDVVTDQPERFIMAELIREKVLLLTREEIPHSVAVVIEEIDRKSNGLLVIRAVIYTEKDSQKGILIGKEGNMLKKVGQLAREEMEILFGSRIFLELWVRVKKDWRNKEVFLREFGYRDNF